MNEPVEVNWPFWKIIAVICVITIFAAIAIRSWSPRMATNSTVAAAYNAILYDAQKVYRAKDRDGDGVLEYARFIKDLYESRPGAQDLKLIDKAFVNAEGDPDTASAKGGYIFKILTAQGPDAPGGAMSYLDSKGNMTLGFAIIAQPGAYDGTGRDCYIVNQDGKIFVADLGPDTAKIVSTMTEYNPTPGVWTPTE